MAFGTADHSESDAIYAAKMASIPTIFILVGLAASLPWILRRLGRAKVVMVFLVCFSAGAMLGIGLLHMIPETREVWEAYFEGDHHDHDHDHDHNHTVSSTRSEFISNLSPATATTMTLAQALKAHLVKPRTRLVAEKLGHGPSEDEIYPYTEMIAGATVIFLVAVEFLLLRYLMNRGNAFNAHGHSHAAVDMEDGLLSRENSAIVNDDTHNHSHGFGEEGNGDGGDDGEEHEPEIDIETKKEMELKKRHIDAYVSALAICVHCIFNGLSLGADESSPAQFWAFFAATVGHKVMDGFAIGVPIYRARLQTWLTVLIIITVAASTPLGVVIGYTVSNTNQGLLPRAIVMSLSTGSFIFVALFELMPAGLRNTKWLNVKLLCVVLGYSVMALVAKWA